MKKIFWRCLGLAGLSALFLTVSPAHANLAIDLPLQGNLLRNDFAGKEIFRPVDSIVERKLALSDPATTNAAKSALPQELTEKLEQAQMMRRFMQSA